MSEPVPYPVLKSLIDKALAGIFLVASSPLFLLVVAGMSVDMLFVAADRGPYVYRERRISRGHEFDLLKLRVLRVDVLHHLGRDEYVRLAEQDTANLTRAGRLLKRWYLDELPQLVNILRGDMSLVGPRPWPPPMVRAQIEDGLDYRLGVQAGWTGPAQITKGRAISRSYAELDLEYVQACRTWRSARLVLYDVRILWRTLGVLLRGEGLRF